MSLLFQVATPADQQEVCRLFRSAIQDMRKRGLRQWEWGVYPSQDMLAQDIEKGALYQMRQDGQLVGAFVLSSQQEAEYAKVAWHFGLRPATLHRLALNPECFGLGLAHRALTFAKEEAVRLGYDSLRLDTSSQNERALRLFRSAMTREAGQVFFSGQPTPYDCFEAPLSPQCPVLPIKMHPAYRYGDETIWGGEGLRNVFGKNIPDSRTGEALEISAIPGYESMDSTGMPLAKLIARYGKALVGTDKPFPLLLKLIDAQDTLSVQVHPDDAYAKQREGKLGKSEAWVILQAQEGASILYGIKRGFHRKDLLAALKAGEDIEPMIHKVPVKAGDVFYIPSGMVHAIGGGILLYEIQQSSDVTYRLWDYGRTNHKGELRELHIDPSMDVINTRLLGEQATLPQTGEEGLHRLLHVPAFTLSCACVQGQLALPAHPASFRMLTALDDLSLAWQGGSLHLPAGGSALLPVLCPPLTLQGQGRALIAAVR